MKDADENQNGGENWNLRGWRDTGGVWNRPSGLDGRDESPLPPNKRNESKKTRKRPRANLGTGKLHEKRGFQWKEKHRAVQKHRGNAEGEKEKERGGNRWENLWVRVRENKHKKRTENKHTRAHRERAKVFLYNTIAGASVNDQEEQGSLSLGFREFGLSVLGVWSPLSIARFVSWTSSFLSFLCLLLLLLLLLLLPLSGRERFKYLLRGRFIYFSLLLSFDEGFPQCGTAVGLLIGSWLTSKFALKPVLVRRYTLQVLIEGIC